MTTNYLRYVEQGKHYGHTVRRISPGTSDIDSDFPVMHCEVCRITFVANAAFLQTPRPDATKLEVV